MELTIFSWAIIHEILRFAAITETLGSFHALAKVSLAPSRMKNISLCLYFGAPGIWWLRRAVRGDLGTVRAVTLEII